MTSGLLIPQHRLLCARFILYQFVLSKENAYMWVSEAFEMNVALNHRNSEHPKVEIPTLPLTRAGTAQII